MVPSAIQNCLPDSQCTQLHSHQGISFLQESKQAEKSRLQRTDSSPICTNKINVMPYMYIHCRIIKYYVAVQFVTTEIPGSSLC